MATADVYEYSIELQYIKDNKAKIIDMTKIKTMLIDYDYDNNNMPIIYIVGVLDRNMVDDMVANANNALINITIYKFISGDETNGIKTIHIREQCAYLISESANPLKEVDNMDIDQKEQETLYKEITIGMIKLDTLNKNKINLNGIVRSTTMTNLIYSIMQKQTQLLMEPLKNNRTLKQIILPPLYSISDALKYLNSISAFYSTSYRFFMDFDTTYLISSSGFPIIKKGEENACNTVSFIIRGLTDNGARVQGMYTDRNKKIYQIDIPVTDVVVNKDSHTEKSYKNLLAIGSTSTNTTSAGEMNVNNSTYTANKTRLIRLPNNNQQMIENIKSDIEDSAYTININKNDLDTSIFTINKEYLVKSMDGNTENDGRYLLAGKKDFFIRYNDNYTLNTMVLLKKKKQ